MIWLKYKMYTITLKSQLQARWTINSHLSIIFLYHHYHHAGEEVAFYFGWMDFYSTCILVPLTVGLVMYLMRGRETTVDTDPYLPLFSVFMAIWAVLFLVVR